MEKNIFCRFWRLVVQNESFVFFSNWSYQAWELSVKTQISATVKLTLWRKIVHEEKKLAEEKGITGFSSAPNPCETYGAHSHLAVACLGRVIVNIVACCYSCGPATGLKTDSYTLSAFWLRKKQMLSKF